MRKVYYFFRVLAEMLALMCLVPIVMMFVVRMDAINWWRKKNESKAIKKTT